MITGKVLLYKAHLHELYSLFILLFQHYNLSSYNLIIKEKDGEKPSVPAILTRKKTSRNEIFWKLLSSMLG